VGTRDRTEARSIGMWDRGMACHGARGTRPSTGHHLDAPIASRYVSPLTTTVYTHPSDQEM
jgi:hypothetical protein